MTYDNFTVNAQEVILKAQQAAGALGQQSVDTIHLVRGIFDTDNKLAEFLFNKVGVNIPMIKKEINIELEKYPKVEGTDKQYLTNDANKALSAAKNLLKDFGDEYISIELILMGILMGNDSTASLLKNHGMTVDNLKSAISELRKGRNVTDQNAENQYNALKKYAVDLNELAESGKLDPIIGRDEEIRRILHILSRRKKNNPILLGDPGVGKTAIVEGIAWRIVK
ncbi:MAG TPA: Clp protease N-terminal domain-containing protein, partial [Saprospiraceae bacterium]|nr:Clp protease N-terminal domain-containing protein [Saprospiraceae bacterium]